jgi:hypothetical protein
MSGTRHRRKGDRIERELSSVTAPSVFMPSAIRCPAPAASGAAVTTWTSTCSVGTKRRSSPRARPARSHQRTLAPTSRRWRSICADGCLRLSIPVRAQSNSACAMNQEEARRLLAAAIRRLYDIENAVRAVHSAAGLVADQISLIETGVLTALQDISEDEE